MPTPFPPTPGPLAFPGGRPRASRCRVRLCAPPPPARKEAHVSCEAFAHKESAGQKCGQRAEGGVFRFCLLCLTALFIVKVNDIIPLCTLMKQLSEDSIGQAVSMADELLRLCRARRATRLTLPRLESAPRPATFSVPGRGEGAEGAKGGRNQKGNSLLTAPGSRTWESQWPHPAICIWATASSGVLRGPGDRKTSLLLGSSSTVSGREAQWHRLSITGVTLTHLLLLTQRDTGLKTEGP